MPPFLVKYGLKMLLSVLGVGALIVVHLVYSGHYVTKGRLACEAAQAELDAQVEPIAADLKKDTDKSDEKHAEQVETIRTEIRTGLSAKDIERAGVRAHRNGQALGRAQAIAEYRSKGGCLSVPYSNGDSLQLNGHNLQRDIFGNVIRSDEAPEADEVRPTP